ncbi:MAG: ABC transporter ATP-binding protein [Nannocystales bacterium]
MSTARRFASRYVARNVPQYALGAVMLFATNWVVVRIPAIVGEALTILEQQGSQALANTRELGVELMVLAAVVIAVRSLSRILFFNPGRDVEYRVGVDVFGHLLSLQRPFYMQRKVGELVSISSNDTTSVRLLVGFAGLQVCNVAVAIPMHLYQMAVTDWQLTLWCLVPVVFGALYMRLAVKRFFAMVRDSMQLLAGLSDRILEIYSGIGTVRSHAAEAAAFERFDARNREYLALQLRLAKVRAFSMPALGFSGLVGTGIVLWVGSTRVVEDGMPVGHLATFTALLMSLVGILIALAWVLAAISRGLVSLGRIDDLLETPPNLPDELTALQLSAPPRLEVSDLAFTYPDGDEPALQGIDLTVEPGQTLGIFGKTGSGKTTLVDVLTRVHTPPAGAVTLDGIDARDVPLADFREAMAVVPQAPFLFSTTVRENVRLEGTNPYRAAREPAPPGSDGTDVGEDTRLDEVLTAACLWDDVHQLPKGLDTIVGERGVMLSGGQRQRVALARALYRSRPLLLLDDVLSAVDQGTEARMVDAIRNLRGGVLGSMAPTTVIVSHRTSVLEHADEIVVLEGGRIVERGTHEQLIAKGGEYAETHEHQGGEGA